MLWRRLNWDCPKLAGILFVLRICTYSQKYWFLSWLFYSAINLDCWSLGFSFCYLQELPTSWWQSSRTFRHIIEKDWRFRRVKLPELNHRGTWRGMVISGIRPLMALSIISIISNWACWTLGFFLYSSRLAAYYYRERSYFPRTAYSRCSQTLAISVLNTISMSSAFFPTFFVLTASANEMVTVSIWYLISLKILDVC